MNQLDDVFDILEKDESFKSVMKRMLKYSLEMSFNGIVVTTAQPGYPILYANSAFLDMTGYAADEVIGQSPAILQGPLTDPEVLGRLRRDIENDEIFHGRAINYRKDGSTFLMEWKIVPIRNPEGVTTHFLAIQKDATGNKT